MNVTAKMEYACIAVLGLAMQYGSKRPLSIREIAQQHNAPTQFLMQIMLQLKRAQLVTSTRGPTGGYCLSRAPDEISLAQVIAAVSNPPEGANINHPSPASRVLARTWHRVNAAEQKILDGTSLADLLDALHRENQAADYQI